MEENRKMVIAVESFADAWLNEVLSRAEYGLLVEWGENMEGGPSLFFDVCYNTSVSKNKKGGPPDEILLLGEGYVK